MRLLRTIQLAALLALLGATASRAADPFYEDLLQQGKVALASGRLADAALDLEIACFGLLEDPSRLADGLTHLALTHRLRGAERPLAEVLNRLLVVEERFGGVSRAALSPATRQQLEDLLLDAVPLERLRTIEAFRPLADRRDLEVLMATRPAQRRARLEERLARDPADFQALQILADLELSEGDPAAALPHLDVLMELSGGDPVIRCRRFTAAARSGRCAVALSDLPACPEDAVTPQLAPAILECHLDAAELALAREFLDGLPAASRTASRLRKLERQLDKEERSADRMAARADRAPASSSPAQASGDDASPAAGAPATGDPATGGPARDTPATGDPTPEAQALGTPTRGARGSGTQTTRGTATPATEVPASGTPGGAASVPPDPCAAARAAARAKRCDELLPGFEACADVALETDVARQVARCHVEGERWTAALAFLDGLPPRIAGLPKLRKLRQRAEKGLERSGDEEILAADVDSEGGAETVDSPSRDSTTPVSTIAASPPRTAPTEGGAPQGDAGAAEPAAADLAALRRQLGAARTTGDLNRALAGAVQLAYSYPESRQAQFLAAEAAYRSAQWQQAVRHFEAGGDPGDDRPLLLFYKAVALFEIGEASRAETYLRRALPRLQRTAFVESYTARILAAARSSP